MKKIHRARHVVLAAAREHCNYARARGKEVKVQTSRSDLSCTSFLENLSCIFSRLLEMPPSVPSPLSRLWMTCAFWPPYCCYLATSIRVYMDTPAPAHWKWRTNLLRHRVSFKFFSKLPLSITPFFIRNKEGNWMIVCALSWIWSYASSTK